MPDYSEYQEKLQRIRRDFSAGEPFDESLVRPVILESWKRSRRYGITMGYVHKEALSPEELRRRIDERRTLCDVVFPILENLFEFTNGSGLLSVFSDEEGYVLKVVGKNYFDCIPSEYLLQEGSTRNERVVGTNGIGTALANGVPLQVKGLEHFYPTYENYTCSGAPIFDADRNIVGVLCLAGPTESSKIHTLGLAIAIAEIISNALVIGRNQQLLREAYDQAGIINKRLGVIFETVASGLMLLDGDLNIVHANSRAAKILMCGVEELTGRPVGDFFDARRVTSKSISQGFENQYLTCETKGVTLDLSVTIQPADPGGYVINFDTAVSLHKKISQLAGLDAFFTFRNILGESPAVQTALELARIAAQTPSNVLLTGESGTGKELFAHAIHNAGDRRNGPFVAINCGALPKSLIESELFGYEAGSFTGAKREGYAGKFELANGGTIFLDEIGDMPLDVQSTLLRVLQNREVVRIGGNRPKKIDVRVIAATNRNLRTAMEQQAFRADLFYRLNVFGIHVPPLRDRPGDIRLLADYFLRKYTAHAAKPLPVIAPKAYALLERFNWPGNVRELENVIERASYIADGLVDEHCLPDHISQAHTPDNAAPTPHAVPEMPKRPRVLVPADADEKAIIFEALEAAGGDMDQAAEKLGISRRTLYRKLQKHHITKNKVFA